ncbi:MAG: DUF6702 family protein [Saprospiraceae bacterium]
MLHPIHISVSEVELSANEITWSSRIYKDDLLLGIYGKNADVTMLGEPEKIRVDIFNYLTSHVSVRVDETELKWSLGEIQPDPEAIWVTITAPLNATKCNTIKIRNHILLSVYNDQKNVVNLTWATGKKNMVFEKGDDQKVISLL